MRERAAVREGARLAGELNIPKLAARWSFALCVFVNSGKLESPPALRQYRPSGIIFGEVATGNID